MSEVILGVLGFVISSISLGFAYAAWRTKELRKDEILDWSAECIDILQRTNVAIGDAARGNPAENFRQLMADLRIRSSVQVERGRLFFKNVDHPWGAAKQPAYRGLRPKILDCLVANFQICEKAAGSQRADLEKLEEVSLSYVRTFVSFAQAEVGRSRPSKSKANEAGHGVDVSAEMIELTRERRSNRFTSSSES